MWRKRKREKIGRKQKWKDEEDKAFSKEQGAFIYLLLSTATSVLSLWANKSLPNSHNGLKLT